MNRPEHFSHRHPRGSDRIEWPAANTSVCRRRSVRASCVPAVDECRLTINVLLLRQILGDGCSDDLALVSPCGFTECRELVEDVVAEVEGCASVGVFPSFPYHGLAPSEPGRRRVSVWCVHTVNGTPSAVLGAGQPCGTLTGQGCPYPVTLGTCGRIT